MTLRQKMWCTAVVIGCVPVVLAARELNSVNPSLFTRVVLAPVPVVVGFVPGPNIGTKEKPSYEGTPLHILAALATVPICAAAYTLLVYALLVLIGRLRQ